MSDIDRADLTKARIDAALPHGLPKPLYPGDEITVSAAWLDTLLYFWDRVIDPKDGM